MRFLKRFSIFSAVFASVVAQGFPIVDDGLTSVVNGNVDITPTNVIVGVTQSDNTLIAYNGSYLGAGSLYVGLNESTGNVVDFYANSIGFFNGEVSVGYESADNEMKIYAGAEVASTFGTIGGGPNSTGNRVLIDGAGSSWNVAGNLVVGFQARENALTVSDGGVVAADSIFIGVFDTATSNKTTVSDGTLEAADKLVVGDAGSYNILTITNGATATAGLITVGASGTATGNVARVGGEDSALTTENALTVGSVSNSGNRVVVSDGGSVQVGELLIGGSANSFELNSSGLLTVDGDFDASMEGFNFNEGGALYIGGSLSGMTNGLEEGRSLGITGTWDLTGTNITVGGSSSSNSLMVLDGGFVGADTVYIGSVSNSGNAVELNSGAQMVLGSGLSISSNNTFTVEDSGHLTVNADFDAGQTGFNFGSGGILETTGTLTGMSNTLAAARSVRLTGGTWNSAGSVAVEGGSSIYVTSGGALSSVGAVLGAETNSVNNMVFVEGTGSSWNIGGTLVVGEVGGSNTVGITDGAALTSVDAMIGLNSDGNSLLISNATWDATGSIAVGGSGSGNRLYIQDGGQVSSASAVIGGTGTDNKVRVQGMDALWSVSGDLSIDGAGNSLAVTDGGNVDVDTVLSVQNGSTLSFTNGTATVGNYFQDASSVLEFNTVTNVAEDSGTALITATGAAEFDAGATIAYTGIIGDVDVGVTNSRLLVASSSLLVGGATNNLDALNGVIINGLLKYDFISVADDLLMRIYRQSLADSAGFEPGTQMFAVSGEIDHLASEGDQVAINQLDVLGDLTGAQQNTQLTQLYEQTAPAYAHMDGMFEGMRQVKNRGVMPDSMWPVGAEGPHLYGSQAQFWMKGYGTWASRDGEGGNSSYDQSVYGIVVGYDKAFGDFLAGLAGGYASSDISQNNGDSSKAGTGYGVLYGSWGTAAWFADGSVALGLGSVKNDSGTVFDTSSDTDASQFAYNLSGGKELVFMEDRMFITPSAGILGGWYSQDGYTEKSSNAVAKEVSSYRRWSFQSEFGVKASYHKELTKNVLMPEVHANWLHQFNADADQLGYSLVGGTGNYNLDMQAPVADLFEIGVGLSLWTESKAGTVSEWVLGLDSRFGDGYSATAFTARMLFEF